MGFRFQISCLSQCTPAIRYNRLISNSHHSFISGDSPWLAFLYLSSNDYNHRPDSLASFSALKYSSLANFFAGFYPINFIQSGFRYFQIDIGSATIAYWYSGFWIWVNKRKSVSKIWYFWLPRTDQVQISVLSRFSKFRMSRFDLRFFSLWPSARHW